jgi:hypothetical protein
MIDLLAVKEPKPKPAKIRAVSYEAAIDQFGQTHAVVYFGPNPTNGRWGHVSGVPPCFRPNG